MASWWVPCKQVECRCGLGEDLGVVLTGRVNEDLSTSPLHGRRTHDPLAWV